MTGVLMWATYAGWLALFVRIAWQGRLRLLLILSAVLIGCFAASWAYIGTVRPSSDRGGDMAYGFAVLFAAAVLLVPSAIAAIVYPLGRLWAR